MDLFGVPIKVLTEEGEEKFSSVQGGIISMIISSLSLLYFSYMINLWVSGNIQPNISLISEAIDYAEFAWNEPLVNFAQSDFNSKIDPFSQTNNIITPLLYTIVNYTITDPPQLLFSNPNKSNNLDINNGTLILNNLNRVGDRPFQLYFLILAKCNETFMTQNSNCANSSFIDQYLSEFHGFLSINVNLKQYNYKTNSFDTIRKSLFQALSPSFPQFTELSFKIQNTIIDDGILLTNQNYYQTINDFDMINQSTDENYVSNIMSSFSNEKQSFQSITAFYLVINNISVIQNIALPKLNTILAEIGSIIQVVFLLKYFAFYINNNLIESEIFSSIVQMYYPNMQQLIINRDVFGKIKHPKYQNQQLNDNFFQHYNQLLDIAKKKTRYINVIYEISRIQYILQKHFSKDSIGGSHEFGQNLNFAIWQENINKVSILPEDTLSSDILVYDINLLIKGQKQKLSPVVNLSY